MGDAAGISPELLLKLWHRGLPHRAVFYADLGVLQRTAQALGLPMPAVRLLHSPDDLRYAGQYSELLLWPCEPLLPAHLPLGQCSALAGQASYQCLRQAIEHAQAGLIGGIVTAPLHKISLKMAGYDFPGHTEILAHHAQVPDVAMVLVNDDLRVILGTIHMPLAQVPSALSVAQQCRSIQLAQQACRQLGIDRPHIAVAGLNPHAGEGGRFGDEEQRIIAPAIAQCRAQGIQVSGPYAGDTVFMRARQGEFDIVLAQYHDQGLIPIKYLGLDTGVNMTVGLPFIRTSVDHGTAFDIVGQGVADEGSLYAAFHLAWHMLKSKCALVLESAQHGAKIG